MRRALLAALALLAWAAAPALRAAPLPAAWLASVSLEHEVRAGEPLSLIGARYGLRPQQLAQLNGLGREARLRPGQRLRVESRHLLPRELAAGLADGVLINAPQRMLYRLQAGTLAAAYPVALGRPSWPTPLGEFRVTLRAKDKTWIVPPSIQDEMREEGKPVLTRVPPGPDNPLGRHWIGLSLPGIGIHGTNAPSSLYGLRSHGCIRLHPDDVAALYERVAVGTPGRIAYRAAILAQVEDGGLWFEAHPDAYRRERTTLEGLQARAREAGVAERIDWTRVAAMLRERDGQAGRVDAQAPGAVPKAGQ